MIGKLTDVLLEVSDLEASTRFYMDQLGLKVRSQGEGWICLDANGASITMWQGPNPKVTIGFTGADLKAIPAALGAKGAKVSELMNHPGGQHYDVLDPDGNVVMIADH